MNTQILLSAAMVAGIYIGQVHAQSATLRSPNVSANALFLYQNSNFHGEDADAAAVDSEPNGINIQEAEVQFYADVDPYSRLNLVLAIHPTYEASGADVVERWVIEPEEATVESNALNGFTMKAGKFKGAIGKHNMLHSHAFPFVKAPLGNVALLGEEGLNDAGLSVAGLLPTSWFSEITLQWLRGAGENEEFNSKTPGDGVGLGRLTNLIDLNESATLEFGASFASGNNSLAKTTNILGGDLTLKWRPIERSSARSLIWGTEFLERQMTSAGVDATEKSQAISTWTQIQWAKEWAVRVRLESLKTVDSMAPGTLPVGTTSRTSLAVAYSPTEFTVLKAEVNQTHGPVANAKGERTENAMFLQANFTIGSHPAHTY